MEVELLMVQCKVEFQINFTRSTHCCDICRRDLIGWWNLWKGRQHWSLSWRYLWGVGLILVGIRRLALETVPYVFHIEARFSWAGGRCRVCCWGCFCMCCTALNPILSLSVAPQRAFMNPKSAYTISNLHHLHSCMSWNYMDRFIVGNIRSPFGAIWAHLFQPFDLNILYQMGKWMQFCMRNLI